MSSKVEYIVTPRLNEILKERGITQVKLSEMTGITQATISRFDKNKQHQDTHLVAIAKVLDLSIEDLFTIEEVGVGIPRTPSEREVHKSGIPREDTERRFSSIRNKVAHSTGDLTREDMEFISALYISQLEKGFYKEKSEEGTSFSIPIFTDHKENQSWNKIKVLQLGSKFEKEKSFHKNVELDQITDPNEPKGAEEIKYNNYETDLTSKAAEKYNPYEVDLDEKPKKANKEKSKK